MKRYISLYTLLSLKAFAESPLYSDSEEIKQVLSQNAYEPNYFSMILGLFFVVGLIYITGYFYQKLTRVKLIKNEIENKAQIISTTSLGQGRSVHVVKVGEEYCLIGSTQNNITFLKDVKINNEASKEVSK